MSLSEGRYFIKAMGLFFPADQQNLLDIFFVLSSAINCMENAA